MWLFIFATIGLTHLIVDGYIFNKPREWFVKHVPFLGKLVTCNQCSGFWCGGVVGGLVFGWDWHIVLYALAGSFLASLGAVLLDWEISVLFDR